MYPHVLSVYFRMEGVDPLFESEIHDCGVCIELIGNNVRGFPFGLLIIICFVTA